VPKEEICWPKSPRSGVGGCGWLWVILGGSWQVVFPPALLQTFIFHRHWWRRWQRHKSWVQTLNHFYTRLCTHTRALPNTSKHLLCPHTHTHRHWGVLTAHAHRCSVAYLAINKFSILFFSPQKRKLKAVWGEGAFWIFYHNFLCFIFLWLSRDNWIAIEFNYF